MKCKNCEGTVYSAGQCRSCYMKAWRGRERVEKQDISGLIRRVYGLKQPLTKHYIQTEQGLVLDVEYYRNKYNIRV